jgi:hypothetical protein
MAMAETVTGKPMQWRHNQLLTNRSINLQTPSRLAQLCSRSLPAGKAPALSGYTLRRGEVSDVEQLAKIDADCYQEVGAVINLTGTIIGNIPSCHPTIAFVL